MAAIDVGDGLPNMASLAVGQTGNGPSTNVADRGARTNTPALVKITTTVGAVPTCSYTLEGSVDGADWFAVSYADSLNPDAWSVGTFVITSAQTSYRFVKVGQPWRFFRVSFSANTNVTNNVEFWVF